MKLSIWRAAVLFSFPAMTALTAITAVSAVAVLPVPSYAADSEHTADCSKAATPSEMEQCSTQALNQADAELNQTYLDYRNRLDQERQNQIRDVQLAWIKYRDLSCKYATGGAGGSAQSMALQLCLADKTRARTGELRALASCAEGDPSCRR